MLRGKYWESDYEDWTRMIPCRHWRECGVVGGGCCSIDAYQRPSVGTCLTQCNKYDGPSRGNIGTQYLMTELALRQIPTHHKQRHAQILVNAPPTTAYIGDRMGAAISKVTGRKPCRNCRKVESGLNKVHRGVRRLVGLR